MSKKTSPESQLSKLAHAGRPSEGDDQLLIYGTDRGFRIEVRYHGETLWMTQRQMSELFGGERAPPSAAI